MRWGRTTFNAASKNPTTEKAIRLRMAFFLAVFVTRAVIVQLINRRMDLREARTVSSPRTNSPLDAADGNGTSAGS